MNKLNRIALAFKTLQIIEKGYYICNDNRINIQNEVAKSVEKTFTIAPEHWDEILLKATKMDKKAIKTAIEVKNCTSIEALMAEKTDAKIAILNFASAKNPGGGFLGGAQAQEESLARSSSLYPTLTKDMTMYHYNKSKPTFLYSDYMIYSPDVAFWLDDEGVFLEKPVFADVITSPAPNKGAMLQNNRPEEIAQINAVLQSRMEKTLALAQTQGVDCLILGAWGCGVFRNEPETVARLFKEIIDEKFQNVFEKIVFAVLDTSDKGLNINAFEIFNLN